MKPSYIVAYKEINMSGIYGFKNLLEKSEEKEEKILYDRKQPIILYAAGLMGTSVKSFLNKIGISIKCFIDRNESIANTSKEGIPVYLPESVPFEEREKSLVLISFVKRPFEEISNYLKHLGYQSIMFAGDFCSSIFSGVEIANIWWSGVFSHEEKENLLKSYELFVDEESRNEYKQSLEWFTNHQNCKDSNFAISKDERYFIPEVVKKLKKDGCFIDSAFVGGEYIKKVEQITENRFKKIYAFLLYPENEPGILDKRINVYVEDLVNRNGQVKAKRIGLMGQYADPSVRIIKNIKLDSIVEIANINYIRFYSISPVLPQIVGSQNILQKSRPIITANIGHYRSDFINIPKLLYDNLPNYKIMFRSHNYYGNDSILYAIPE